MATRANIGIENEDGTIDFIYSHWDGDIVGAELLKKWNSKEKARELINEGDCSYPGESYISKGEDVTLNSSRTATSPKEVHEEEYSYIFTNKWLVSNNGILYREVVNE